jgi:hypothetical protein
MVKDSLRGTVRGTDHRDVQQQAEEVVAAYFGKTRWRMAPLDATVDEEVHAGDGSVVRRTFVAEFYAEGHTDG